MDEIKETMRDLRAWGVDILTIGQYLQPSRKHLPIERYYTPEEFADLKDFGMEIGFVITLYVAIFFGTVQGFNLWMFVFALLGGFVAGSATKNIRYRWDFFKAIPPIVVIYALLVGLWHVSSGRPFSMSVTRRGHEPSASPTRARRHAIHEKL